jgi:hypothetical protein
VCVCGVCVCVVFVVCVCVCVVCACGVCGVCVSVCVCMNSYIITCDSSLPEFDTVLCVSTFRLNTLPTYSRLYPIHGITSKQTEPLRFAAATRTSHGCSVRSVKLSLYFETIKFCEVVLQTRTEQQS